MTDADWLKPDQWEDPRQNARGSVDFLRSAPGVSLQDIRDRLRGGGCCAAVIYNFSVYVHPEFSHEVLYRALGAEWEDQQGTAKFSIVFHGKHPHLAVRWKSDAIRSLTTQADNLLRTEFSDVIRYFADNPVAP